MPDQDNDRRELDIGSMKVVVEKDASGHHTVRSPDVKVKVGGREMSPTVGAKVERREDGTTEVSVKIGIRIELP